MKNLVIRALRFFAHRQLTQFHPTIIAVTGSVGKTSTKQAIAVALSSTYTVRSSQKNYNNEFGVPLAILGEKSPGKNAWGWVKLFVRQWNVKTFPTHVVLEYGADRPGDIQASCNIAQPHVAVLTAISPVHVVNYPNFGALAEEKATLGDNVGEDGVVLLNADDQTLHFMRDRFSAPTETYGKSGKHAAITDVYVKIDDALITTKAAIDIEGTVANIQLKNCLGDSSVYACAAALLVAKHCDIPLEKAAKALSESFTAAPGRLCPIAGIKGAIILDDTYNAAPASTLAALDAVMIFATKRPDMRRVVALGKMAELGQYSEAEHIAVGRRVAEVADIFVAVGAEMHEAAAEAMRMGMKFTAVVCVQNAEEAGRWLDANIHPGDIVLVKGSQSARMEKAVKDIMAEPLRAEELLVRQEAAWLKA